MSYEAERGCITLALSGDIMPSRGLTVYREPEFLVLRVLLRQADASFANLESIWPPRSQRGRPLLADAELGKKILERVARLSEPYGTRLEQRNGRGVIRFP